MQDSSIFSQKVKFKPEKSTLIYKFDNQDFITSNKDFDNDSSSLHWIFKYLIIEVNSTEFSQNILEKIWEEICLHNTLAGFEVHKIAILNKTNQKSFSIEENISIIRPKREIPTKQFTVEVEIKEWFEFEEVYELKRKMALSNLMLF